MNLQVGKQYLDRRCYEWTIDYVGKNMASGHNAEKAVRMWFIDGTVLVNCPSCNDLISEYTEPEFVPWETPQEIPALAWFRNQADRSRWLHISTVLHNESEDAWKIYFNGGQSFELVELRHCFEHSLDNGVTWLPCGKEKK